MNAVIESEEKTYDCPECKDTGWRSTKFLGGVKMWCPCGKVKLEVLTDNLDVMHSDS